MDSYSKIINSIDSLALGVIGSLIATGIAACTIALKNLILKYSRIRRFWGRAGSSFTAVSGQIYFEEAQHRYMAAGDIKAVLSVVLTLHSLFKLKKVPHRFSDSIVPNEDLRGNVISIGGPKFNRVTKTLLDNYGKRYPEFPAVFSGNTIVCSWRNHCGVLQAKEVIFNKAEGHVIDDYGLLVRAINPFDDTETTRAWVVAGSGSNGCQAAADQLSKYIYGSRFRLRRLRQFLSRGDIGLVITKANFHDSQYVSSTPIFYASYRKTWQFPYFWRRDRKWVCSDNFPSRVGGAEITQPPHPPPSLLI